ncbi:MAG: hypothetical protein JWN18_246 [Parcubacteria group bacterium]|nr:hypothetical protein [Parcubacteria group bacterium]
MPVILQLMDTNDTEVKVEVTEGEVPESGAAVETEVEPAADAVVETEEAETV